MSRHLIPALVIAGSGAFLLAYSIRRSRLQDDSNEVLEFESAEDVEKLLSRLRNEYYIMRHGQSEANELGKISSKPEVAKLIHGLTDKGRKQAEVTAESILRDLESSGEQMLIIHSPFKRAKETALVVKNKLGDSCSGIEEELELRERWFGEFDGLSDSNYQRVWDEDIKDEEHHIYGVESPKEVLQRTLRVIQRLERRFQSKRILLVAHGDTLQILTTGFSRVSPKYHRAKVDPLQTAAVRKLVWKKEKTQ